MSLDWNDQLQHIPGLDELARQAHTEQQSEGEPEQANPQPNRHDVINAVADDAAYYYQRSIEQGLPPRTAHALTVEYQIFYLNVIMHNICDGH